MDLQSIPHGYRVVRMEHETIMKIKEAMKIADRSSSWVSRNAAIPSTTFHRKLKGGSPFTIPEIVRIAQALSINPSRLLPSEFSEAA